MAGLIAVINHPQLCYYPMYNVVVILYKGFNIVKTQTLS